MFAPGEHCLDYAVNLVENADYTVNLPYNQINYMCHAGYMFPDHSTSKTFYCPCQSPTDHPESWHFLDALGHCNGMYLWVYIGSFISPSSSYRCCNFLQQYYSPTWIVMAIVCYSNVL